MKASAEEQAPERHDLENRTKGTGFTGPTIVASMMASLRLSAAEALSVVEQKRYRAASFGDRFRLSNKASLRRTSSGAAVAKCSVIVLLDQAACGPTWFDQFP
ncbi:hypothetical protein [Microvirga calopogonii]|uniref:hypothetical protein n=1 Tax=Microvirga calopogonii TaxID=2078013 RepID=UPI000E0D9E1F|nr:hypothetical protein [Microvirga calopogonii]